MGHDDGKPVLVEVAILAVPDLPRLKISGFPIFIGKR